MSVLTDRARSILAHRGVRNGMWMYLLQAFNTVVPLLTLPYVTRVLGAEGYGVFSIALNVFGYLQVGVEYGFGMSATRKVAVSDGDHDLIERELSRVLAARALLALVCSGLCLGYAVVSQGSAQSLCLLIMLVSIAGVCIQQNWLFQGMQDMRLISVVNIVGRTASVALTFLLVRSPDDIYLYSLLYSVSPLVSGVVGFAVAMRTYGVRPVRVGWDEVANELRDGFYVFTTQLSSKVFGAFGVTVLGLVVNSSVVGVYSAVQKVPNLLMLVWMPVSQVLYPISSRRLHASLAAGMAFVYRCRRYTLAVFGTLAVVIAMFSSTIVEIAFGFEYAERSYWVLPLLGWLLLGINNNFLGIQILLGSGHDREYSRCFQIGVAATVAFNITLVLAFGGDGASIAPLLSELVLGLLLAREVRGLDSRGGN